MSDREYMDYKTFIEDKFQIVNKEKQLVDMKLNHVQDRYLLKDTIWNDIVLKARQEGFSSLIDAVWTSDFILEPNSFSVIVADRQENSIGLLDRVKLFIQSYNKKTRLKSKKLNIQEEEAKVKVPLTYESRFELFNPFMNSRFIIGTANSVDFGRSKTFTNLHLSEVAFYRNIEKIIASAGQALIDYGKLILETTANGFNEFKTTWDEAKRGVNDFKPLFYAASLFYSKEFLDKKRKQLKRLFSQEYPETDLEAFLTSGKCYFDVDAIQLAKTRAKGPLVRTMFDVATI